MQGIFLIVGQMVLNIFCLDISYILHEICKRVRVIYQNNTVNKFTLSAICLKDRQNA